MSNRHCELYRFLSIENKGAHYFDTSESCERDGRRDLSWDMSSVSMNGHQQARNALLSAAELARKLNVPTNRITYILNGRRGITGDTALRLSHLESVKRSGVGRSE